jgi:hypothetical protein
MCESSRESIRKFEEAFAILRENPTNYTPKSRIEYEFRLLSGVEVFHVWKKEVSANIRKFKELIKEMGDKYWHDEIEALRLKHGLSKLPERSPENDSDNEALRKACVILQKITHAQPLTMEDFEMPADTSPEVKEQFNHTLEVAQSYLEGVANSYHESMKQPTEQPATLDIVRRVLQSDAITPDATLETNKEGCKYFQVNLQFHAEETYSACLEVFAKNGLIHVRVELQTTEQNTIEQFATDLRSASLESIESLARALFFAPLEAQGATIKLRRINVFPYRDAICKEDIYTYCTSMNENHTSVMARRGENTLCIAVIRKEKATLQWFLDTVAKSEAGNVAFSL